MSAITKIKLNNTEYGLSNITPLTQAQYNNLTPEQKMDPDSYYFITDVSPVNAGDLSDLDDVNISNL